MLLRLISALAPGTEVRGPPVNRVRQGDARPASAARLARAAVRVEPLGERTFGVVADRGAPHADGLGENGYDTVAQQLRFLTGDGARGARGIDLCAPERLARVDVA